MLLDPYLIYIVVEVLVEMGLGLAGIQFWKCVERLFQLSFCSWIGLSFPMDFADSSVVGPIVVGPMVVPSFFHVTLFLLYLDLDLPVFFLLFCRLVPYPLLHLNLHRAFLVPHIEEAAVAQN